MACFVHNPKASSYIFTKNSEVRVILYNETKEEHFKYFTLKCPVVNTKLKEAENKSDSLKICSAAISNSNEFVVACDSENWVHLWKQENDSWNSLDSRKSIRKSQKVIFTNLSDEIILADRGGDVFIFATSDPLKEGKFALGHISFITDISVSNDDKFLISCDRDGKIKISCYPNCYVIHSYCLGHTEFISSVSFLDINSLYLLSGSGDGSLRLWNFLEGAEIGCESISMNSNLMNVIKDLTAENFECFDDSFSNIHSKEPALKFSVRQVLLCQKLNLLAVLYHFVHGICIYKVCNNIFQFVQFLPLPSVALNAIFFKNDLLAITKQASNFLKYFSFDINTNKFLEKVDKILEISENKFPYEMFMFYKDFEFVISCSNEEHMLFKKLFDDNDEDEFKSKKNKNC